MKVYIARDGNKAGWGETDLYLFMLKKPVWKESSKTWDLRHRNNDCAELDKDSFPDILNGECKEFDLIPVKEQSAEEK
jgi:hypothetical protein